ASGAGPGPDLGTRRRAAARGVLTSPPLHCDGGERPGGRVQAGPDHPGSASLVAGRRGDRVGVRCRVVGNKFVTGYWTARTLRQEVEQFGEDVTRLIARRAPSRSSRIPDESSLYALARCRVILHQADRLTRSVLKIIACESEVRARLGEVR